MTPANYPRRSVAKGAAWAVPVVVAGSAAPALAASCDPSTTVVPTTSTLSFSSTGSLVDSPSTVSVTYVNNGPDALAVGTVLTIVLIGGYAEGGTTPTVSPAGMPSSTTFDVAGQIDTTQETSAYRFVVRATLGQALASGQSLAIVMNPTGFTTTESTDTSDTTYGGGEIIHLSTISDATDSSQDVVEACRTVSETITVAS